MDRSSCGMKVYGGCPGAECDRPCSATLWIPPSTTPLGRSILKSSRIALLKASAVILGLFIAGYAGAAVTAAGLENWENTRSQHEPV
jgi:hypothetical protein